MRTLILLMLLLAGLATSQPLLAQSQQTTAAPAIIAEDEIIVTAGVDDASDNMEIYAMKIDGSAMRQLTDDDNYETMWGRLSPDRTQIVFHRSDLNATSEFIRYPSTSVWLMNADGSNVREIRPRQTDGWFLQGHVEWSPDGQSLLIIGRKFLRGPSQLYILDLDGNVIRQVYESEGDMADPAFSADGTEIVFAGCPETGCVSADIYTIKADGSAPPIKLTDDDIQENDPYFSPDGRTISWNHNIVVSLVPFDGDSLAMLGDYDGTQLTNVRQIGDNQLNAVPIWSMDGERLYVHRFDFNDPKWDVWSADLDGENAVNISADLRPPDKPRFVFWFPHEGTHSTIVTVAEPVPTAEPTALPTKVAVIDDVEQEAEVTQSAESDPIEPTQEPETNTQPPPPAATNGLPLLCIGWVIGGAMGYWFGQYRHKRKMRRSREQMQRP